MLYAPPTKDKKNKEQKDLNNGKKTVKTNNNISTQNHINNH